MINFKSLPRVSVIIVNWNVADSLKRCLDSVFATKYSNLEVIVIDNASTDNSIAVIETYSSKKLIKIINDQNLGFPKAVNQGLAIATGDYLLLLNPDTRLPKDFFIQAVRFVREYPDCDVMGAKMTNTDGSLQGSVFQQPSVINTIKEFWLGQKNLTQKYSPKQKTPSTVFALSGACMFIPKSTIAKFGKFTESVFMYFEDLDFCRRINQGGGKVYYNPLITIVHQHGQSSKQTNLDKYRNFWESLIYPIRKVFNLPNNLPSFQRYQNESGIWYHGWLKHTLIAFIIWSSQKLHRSVNN